MISADELREELDDLVDMAVDDIVDLAHLTVLAYDDVGDEAPLNVEAQAFGRILGMLVDRGVVPGDLDAERRFHAWPGGRDEIVRRMEREILALGALPSPVEIAWLTSVENAV